MENPYCPKHGGRSRSAFVKAKFNYNITKWNEKIRGFAVSPQAKSLREEIAILRCLMEARLEILNPADQFDVIRHSGPIGDLAVKIEKLVSSCHRLEEKTGATLDRTKVVLIAQRFVEIVAQNLQALNVEDAQAQAFLENVVNGIGNTVSGDPQSGINATQPQNGSEVRGERASDGRPVSRAVDVQVSSVAEGDAQHEV